jgi:glycosyltransferase involved in cell wall biosynthesis
MSGEPNLLSIILVAFNEEQHLGIVLDAVAALRRPTGVEIEVIVIDGGSRDQTVALARSRGARVEILPGANIPVCRNAGLRAARGAWIAFLDADCEPASDWLEKALLYLRQPEPLVMGWPVSPPLPGTWLQRAWHTHWLNKNPQMGEWNGHRVARHEAFRLITTRNMILHREVAERLEGFDEMLPTGEDTDFVFRADRRGLTVLGVPELRVVHHGEPATLRQFFRQQIWHANRSSYAKIVKESGARSGGNAPKFTVLFLLGTALALAGGLAALVLRNPWPLAGLVPLLALLGLPALRIALKGRKPQHVPALMMIYAVYGAARSLDLLGFFRGKASWKSPK